MRFKVKSSVFELKRTLFLVSKIFFAIQYPHFIFALHFLNPIEMYAIVDIAGKQFKVEKDQYIYAPKMEGEAGTVVKFDQVLLVDNSGKVSIGTPVVKGASVSGKILEEEVKGDKEIIFKKKRRKGYAVKNGHRQKYTKVMIESISE
jgi:large subunit ribosomal protein L21